MRKDSLYLPFFSNGHPADCPAKAASLQYHPQLSMTESRRNRVNYVNLVTISLLTRLLPNYLIFIVKQNSSHLQ